jgi:hypothetical protein
MAERLALAAAGSPEWDREEGRVVSGDVNGWILDLLSDPALYEEILSLFRDEGLEIRPASVEKVLVGRADGLPFLDALLAAGARSSDRVPFDCQVWFSVRPLAGAEGGSGSAIRRIPEP